MILRTISLVKLRSDLKKINFNSTQSDIVKVFIGFKFCFCFTLFEVIILYLVFSLSFPFTLLSNLIFGKNKASGLRSSPTKRKKISKIRQEQ